MIICAAVVAFITILTRCTQMTQAEKAIQEKSLPRLISIINQHPQLIDVPDKENGFTPLHWAVMDDQTNMVKFLLSRGANVNAKDHYGMMPLHKAAAFNRIELVKLLIAAGADLYALGTKYGVIKLAPLHLAAESGHADLVKLFLEQGVDVNLRTGGKNQVTSLHMASAKGHAAVVEQLLKAGATVNARDAQGATPLAWAIKAEQWEVADMLRIYGGSE